MAAPTGGNQDMSWQIQHDQATETKIYRATALNQPGLVQAVSTQSSGNMALHTGERPELVIGRRQRFLQLLQLDLENLVAANQVHGVTIQKVDRRLAGAGAKSFETAIPDTDALTTEVPGIVLSTFTADCLPIFLYDPDRPAVAVVHAGWRGTIGRIVERTLEAMARDFQTVPGRVRAAIGPAICGKCFQVNRDLADNFSKADPLAVNSEAGAFYVDLAGFNARLLTTAGVAPEHISLSETCTSCHPQTFFSYRAGNQTIGRMMGIISLK